MPLGDKRVANLWLADELWKLGALQFGDFTLGDTAVNSPVYINLRLLISNPNVLQRTAAVEPPVLKLFSITLPLDTPLEVETWRPAVAMSPNGDGIVYVGNRDGRPQLFNLLEDPGEEHSRNAFERKTLERLIGRHQRWLDRTTPN